MWVKAKFAETILNTEKIVINDKITNNYLTFNISSLSCTHIDYAVFMGNTPEVLMVGTCNRIYGLYSLNAVDRDNIVVNYMVNDSDGGGFAGRTLDILSGSIVSVNAMEGPAKIEIFSFNPTTNRWYYRNDLYQEGRDYSSELSVTPDLTRYVDCNSDYNVDTLNPTCKLYNFTNNTELWSFPAPPVNNNTFGQYVRVLDNGYALVSDNGGDANRVHLWNLQDGSAQAIQSPDSTMDFGRNGLFVDYVHSIVYIASSNTSDLSKLYIDGYKFGATVAPTTTPPVTTPSPTSSPTSSNVTPSNDPYDDTGLIVMGVIIGILFIGGFVIGARRVLNSESNYDFV